MTTATSSPSTFSPDGTLLATAGADETARPWRLPDGTAIRALKAMGRRTASHSAPGR